MKNLFAVTAVFATSFALPTLAHDSPLPVVSSTTDGYATVYQIISITPRPERAGYQELDLNPVQVQGQIRTNGTYPGGEAIVIYPYSE